MADWDHSRRIEVPMALEVMLTDVIHIDGLGDARHLIQLAQICTQVRIVRDTAAVGLEVGDRAGIARRGALIDFKEKPDYALSSACLMWYKK